MDDFLLYRIGRGSLAEAKKALRKLLGDMGEISVYLDEDSLEDLLPAIEELLILSNIRYLRGEEKEPGSIKLDFLKAYIKSRRKLVLSDIDIEEYMEPEKGKEKGKGGAL